MAYLSLGICLAIMLFSIKGSIKDSLLDMDARYGLNRLIYYFSIFITFLLMLTNLEKIYLQILKFGSNYSNLSSMDSNLLKVIALGMIFFVFQFISYQTIKLICSPFTKGYSMSEESGKGKVIVLSSIFGALKGFVIILIMFMGIITFNNTIGRGVKVNIFDNIGAYNKLESIMSINKQVLSYDEVKEYIPANSNVIIYYNGVTLDEGVKSSNDINAKALELVKNSKTDRDKAKRIYSWVGSNIKYDNDKASKALSNEGVTNSGALEAWNTRSGICFDYACLYVAMAKSTGLKVRIITGKAFDGKNYGPHAWNEVYLEDEQKWIKVDPTFYLAGDYFDNENFDSDHIKENIAGEW